MKTMKFVTWIAGILGAAALVVAGEPAPGWSREDVLEALGPPRGYIRMGAMEMLYYDRGYVRLLDGTAEEVDFVSSEEAKRRIVEREVRAQEAAEARAEHRRQRMEAGLAERDRLLEILRRDSPPAASEVRIWERFQDHYPGVPVDDQLALARIRLAEAQREDELAQRITELEGRVREAERRAWVSEQEALRRSARISWVGLPVVVRPAPPRRSIPPSRPRPQQEFGFPPPRPNPRHRRPCEPGTDFPRRVAPSASVVPAFGHFVSTWGSSLSGVGPRPILGTP